MKHGCQSDISDPSHLEPVPCPGRVPCCSWCREWHPAKCSAIPALFVQVGCTTLNRRWIHPCRITGAVFSAAEGYACPFCKVTFESQLAGDDGLGGFDEPQLAALMRLCADAEEEVIQSVAKVYSPSTTTRTRKR